MEGICCVNGGGTVSEVPKSVADQADTAAVLGAAETDEGWSSREDAAVDWC